MPILELNTCLKFGFINRTKVESIISNSCLSLLVKDYKEIFNGLGSFPGECKI